MAEAAVEKVIAEIQSLNPEQREEVRRFLNGTPVVTGALPQPPFQPRYIGRGQPVKDRTKEYEWLRQHRDEYANQWVALNDSRLISHGAKLKEVIAEARRAGEPDALMIFVEPSNIPPFLMLWS
jgi:hypothetical protein